MIVQNPLQLKSIYKIKLFARLVALKKRFQYFNKYFNESYLKSIFVLLYGRKYVKIIFESSFHLAVLTNFHRDRLIKLGIEENRVSVIPNYIYPKNNSASKSSSIDLVYAGRISEEKGVEELVKEFIRLDIKGINLQIIGTGRCSIIY